MLLLHAYICILSTNSFNCIMKVPQKKLSFNYQHEAFNLTNVFSK